MEHPDGRVGYFREPTMIPELYMPAGAGEQDDDVHLASTITGSLEDLRVGQRLRSSESAR
jgi:hypothetical protein